VAVTLDPNKIYTVAELQEIALANSVQALVDDVDIKRKDMTVRTIQSDSAMSDTILRVTKPMDVKLELESAKNTKQDHLNQLKVDVYKTALNIQLCGSEIELQQQKQVNAGEKLEIADARFKKKTITQDELETAKFAVESSKVDLADAREKLDMQYLELKKLLNQPLDTKPVHIAVDLKQAVFKDVDINLVLEGLYKTEATVNKASGKLSIAQAAMDIAAKLYKEDNLIYKNYAADLEEAALDLASAKSALDVKVNNSCSDLKNKLDNITLAGKYCDLMTKKLASAQVRYDKGTVGKEALISAKEASLDADFAKLKAIVDYNSAAMELDCLLGRDLH
jgi:outer membrane protein TolC